MSFFKTFFDNTFINIILLSIVEFYGDYELEKYAKTDNLNNLIKGSVGYISVVYFLIKSLVTTNLLYVNLLWDGVSALINTLATIILLEQRFESVEHIVGAALIIIGLILIKFKKAHF
jgi:multidrug transporter EmrE-like cation transporter